MPSKMTIFLLILVPLLPLNMGWLWAPVVMVDLTCRTIKFTDHHLARFILWVNGSDVSVYDL